MFFGGCKLQLFWGMSDTSDTFFGVGECLVQVYVARKKESTPPPPTRGHKKTPSLIPLIQGRLPHDSPWFCVSVMNLLYSETSSHVKLRYKMSYKYVILGGGGGGGGGGGRGCSRILFHRNINVIVLIS